MRVLSLAVTFLLACGGAAPPPPPPAAPPPKAAAPAPDPVTKPANYVEVRVLDVIPVGDSDTLLLVDDESKLVLPIAIGGTEGSSIAARVHGIRRQRPLTHDLMDEAVRKLGGRIVKVHVDALIDGIFHGSIYIRTPKGKIMRLDSRTSDAVALGIGNGVPIYVSRAVLEEAGIERDKVMPQSSPPGPVT
jgi:bifunctional DNase/RNase